VALDYWVRNLTPDEDGTLKVSLFSRPSLEDLAGVTDNHLFALTAIVQHGALSSREVAGVINAESGFCEMALDYFHEMDVLRRSPGTGRYSLTPRYFRPVVEKLTSSNFLWE